MRQFFERFFFAVHIVIALCGLGGLIALSREGITSAAGACVITAGFFAANELVRWVCLGVRKPDAQDTQVNWPEIPTI